MHKIWVSLVALVMCPCGGANTLAAAPSPTVQYATTGGSEFRVKANIQKDGRTVTYVGTGDSMLGSDDTCKHNSDFACVDLGGGGNPLRLIVPRDLGNRIAAVVSVMKATHNRQSMEQLHWTDNDFDYRVEPRRRYPNNYPIVWEPIRFFGTKIDAVLVVVYKSGQAGLRHPVTQFLYNPEHGVLALNYPYGNENGGTEFVSYWLEGTCGLIPIQPCSEGRNEK